MQLSGHKNYLRIYITISFFVLLFLGAMICRRYYKADIVGETAMINVDANNVIGSLNDEMFGGGVPGADPVFFLSYYPQVLKNMGIKVIHTGIDPFFIPFTDTIGPKNQREIMRVSAGQPIYYPGPDEWTKTASEAESELSVVIPYNDGSEKYLDQAGYLVEYTNVTVTPEIDSRALNLNWQIGTYEAFDANVPSGYFAWLRKQYNGGKNEPIKEIKYWEIGNEVFGSWYGGSGITAESYITKAIEFGKRMKIVDPTVQVGASFDSNWSVSFWDQKAGNNRPWSEVLIDEIVHDGHMAMAQNRQPSIDFVAPHFYGPGVSGGKNLSFDLWNPKQVQYKDIGGNTIAELDSLPVSFARTVHLNEGRYTLSVEGSDVGIPDQLSSAEGILVDGDVYYVADTNNHRVIKASTNSNLWQTCGTYGTGEGEFRYPKDLTLDKSTDDVYVTDTKNNRIVRVKFGPGGCENWAVYGEGGSGQGQFKQPNGIEIDSLSGFIYVADTDNNRIVKAKFDGSFWESYGSYGQGTGKLSCPVDLDYVPSTGDIYISSACNQQIVKTKPTESDWQASWQTLGSRGCSGSGEETSGATLCYANSLVYDSVNGDLFIADTGNQRVIKTNFSGSNWLTVGNTGQASSGVGEFSYPKGISYNQNTLYISDTNNNRIAKLNKSTLAISSWQEGYKGGPAHAKLGVRFFDLSGTENNSLDSSVSLPDYQSLISGGMINMDSASFKKYNFTEHGYQSEEKKVIDISKSQNYRMEFSFYNFLYVPGVTQGIANAEIGSKLSKKDDVWAQSFVANDYKVAYTNLMLARSSIVSPENALLGYKIFPDNGNNEPDESAVPLVTAMFPEYRTINNLSNSSGSFEFNSLVQDCIHQASDLVVGEKYWLVLQLDRDLTEGYLTTQGDKNDSYMKGELKIKKAGGGYVSDASLKDMYFNVQDNLGRSPTVKNLKIIDQNGNSQSIALNEKEWLEGVSLAGHGFEPFLKTTNKYFETANSKIKSDNPDYLGHGNFIPYIFTSESSYTESSKESPYIERIFDKLNSAMYTGNYYVSIINNSLFANIMWSISAGEGPFMYQHNWNIFGFPYIDDRSRVTYNGFNPLDMIAKTPRYFLFQLLNQNRGDKVLNTEVISPSYKYLFNNSSMLPDHLAENAQGGCDKNKYYYTCSPINVKQPYFERNYLQSFTSYSQSKEKIYLTVVNNNDTDSISTNINIANFVPGAKGIVRTLKDADGRGQLSRNGYYTQLNEVTPDGSSRIKVVDAGPFKNGDKITIQDGSQGYAEYFEIGNVDYVQNTMELLDATGASAKTVHYWGLGWSVDGHSHFANAEVNKLTPEVVLKEVEINNVGLNFSYNFPLHSITQIELSKKHIRRPTVNSFSGNLTTQSENITVSGTAEPDADIEIILNGTAVATAKADDTGEWQAMLSGNLSSGIYSVAASSVSADGAVSEQSEAVQLMINFPLKDNQEPVVVPQKKPEIDYRSRIIDQSAKRISSLNPRGGNVGPALDLSSLYTAGPSSSANSNSSSDEELLSSLNTNSSAINNNSNSSQQKALDKSENKSSSISLIMSVAAAILLFAIFLYARKKKSK